MSDSYGCPHQNTCSALPPHVHFHAVAAHSGLAALRAFTVNHRNAGLGALQHASMTCEAAMRLHGELSTRDIESVVIATCNRTELYWRARVPGDDETAAAVFAQAFGIDSPHALAGFRLSGETAATHLFRVCCGLESFVLGEAEILGQVKAALEACTGAGAFLEGVFTAAMRAGRAARVETDIGVGALSVASAAVQWLSQRLPLADRRVLVIGAGDTGQKVARHVRALGAGALVIANRTLAHAQAVAGPLGASAVGLEAMPREVDTADAIICAASASGWLVRGDDLRRARASRCSSLVVVDLAMPAGVEPVAVDGVTLVGLPELEDLVEANRCRRAGEVPKVEAVIARELGWLHAWARHQALRPLVSDLRRKVEEIRRAELVRARQELRRSPEAESAVLERLSRRLLDRVLAVPLATLEAGDLPLDAAHADYLRRLFALDAGAPPCA
jgi:glutamyl-tRNA reductase